jgi:cholesterol oxidase
VERFDAVIVGSGFGGSVMAQRLAEGGQRVCVLERGKAYPPGSFPRSPSEMRLNFWDPSEGYHGLFDVWTFRHMEAVVSSGLGGGSLIYANVLIRKPEKWFVREERHSRGYEYWPVTRADLDPHYDRVERMLQPQRYPFQHFPYSETAKTRALQFAAQQLGYEWKLPNLAVTFGNPGAQPALGIPIVEGERNIHGLPRVTCRLCGECDIGCNLGSKNTLDYNYLSRAAELGAEIRTRCEVRALEPTDGGYQVDYVCHEDAEEGERRTREPDLKRLHARRLILSAGTLGTTFLLLKNRAHFENISPTLGSRFCGNGDFLSFVFRCREPHGTGDRARPIRASRGTVITSTLIGPDDLDGGTTAAGPGFLLQDAGYPGFVDWLMEAADAGGWLHRLLVFAWRRVQAALQSAPRSDISGEFVRLFGDCELSAGSMPLLGMGRDEADGNLSLRKGRGGKVYLDVDWKQDLSRAHFERLQQVSKDVARTLGGEFRPNPLTHKLARLITVHPLGGCAMGRNIDEGVVNEWGEVYNYPGLYVADGSVMPGPVGVNPSLTIAALADRFADGILSGSLSER